MNAGSTIFTQLMAFGSRFALDRCIQRYRGNHRVRRFSCREQFLVMAFAQLTFRESLRDIEVSLGAVPERLYHLGLRHPVSRSTLADANEKRDWRIYADFAQRGLDFQRRYSRKVDRTTGLRCDQTIVLQGPLSSKKYPDALRRVRVRDLETGKTITLLTNDFQLSARTIADLYRSRW